jgi:DNA-binding transcriptional LysR family regulator
MGNSEDVLEILRHRNADLGFVEGQGVPKGFSSRSIADDELVVIVPPAHRWARRPSIGVAELASTPLILRESGSGTRAVFEAGLARGGLDVSSLVELGSTTAIKSAVLSGAGPAVMSRLAVASEIEQGVLVVVPIDGLDLHRKIRATWLTSPSPPIAAKKLLALLAKETPTHVARS